MTSPRTKPRIKDDTPMSTADTKDDEVVADGLAKTIDSGSRPRTDPGREVTDSGADTLLARSAPDDEPRPQAPASAAEPVDDLLGVTLGERYQVTAKLGQGGMGAVYEAKHTVIGKRVALKVLLDKHAEKDQSVARLKQEARLASSIGHENIIDITDFGTTDTGRTFVVMEYLDGESLGSVIASKGRLGSQRAIRIGKQIASALGAAHDKGIVHRDIKPENIFVLTRDGQDFIKVLDFGISKSLVADDEDVRLTQTGMVLGTPLYMSPEQAQGDDDLDHRIDIYALGVILYEAVTGEVPFRGKNYLNILTQVISDDPKFASEYVPDLDQNLESVICKAMAKDREERYQSMEEFASDLEQLDLINPKSTSSKITAARWRRNQRTRSKRSYATWIAAVAVVAGASVMGVTLLIGDDPSSSATKAAVAAAISYDASGDISPTDAAPAFVKAHITLESDPPGATVLAGSLNVCAATPCSYQPAMTGEQITLRVVHEGYIDGSLTITPELDNQETLRIRLDPSPADAPTSSKGKGKGKGKGKNASANTDVESPPESLPRGGQDTLGNPHQ